MKDNNWIQTKNLYDKLNEAKNHNPLQPYPQWARLKSKKVGKKSRKAA